MAYWNQRAQELMDLAARAVMRRDPVDLADARNAIETTLVAAEHHGRSCCVEDQKRVNKTMRLVPGAWSALAEAAGEHGLPESNMLEVFIDQGAKSVLGQAPASLDEQIASAEKAWAGIDLLLASIPARKNSLLGKREVEETPMHRARLNMFEAREALGLAINELQAAQVASLTDNERSDLSDG